MSKDKRFKFGYVATDSIGNPKNVFFIRNDDQVYILIINKTSKDLIPIAGNPEELLETRNDLYELMAEITDVIYFDKFMGFEYSSGLVKRFVCELTKIRDPDILLVKILHQCGTLQFIINDARELYDCLSFEP